MKKAFFVLALGLAMFSVTAKAQNVTTLYQEKTWTFQTEAVADLQKNIWDLMVSGNNEEFRALCTNSALMIDCDGMAPMQLQLSQPNNNSCDRVLVYDMNVAFAESVAIAYSTITVVATKDGQKIVTPYYVTSVFQKERKSDWKLESTTYSLRTNGPDATRIRVEHL